MTFPLGHPVRIAAAAGAMMALLAAAVIALLGAGTTTRAGLIRQLERPATFASTSVGPRPVAVTVPAGLYAVRLSIVPNRAGARNVVTIALARQGRPVSGASASVAYSMPAMNMQNALTSSLAERRAARYSVREPILGMPGSWSLRFTVKPHGGAPFSVTVNDLLR